VAYGWAKHDDGHCSYQGYRARHCPDKELNFWETLVPTPCNCPPTEPCPTCEYLPGSGLSSLYSSSEYKCNRYVSMHTKLNNSV
jgi:hypothetical protein